MRRRLSTYFGILVMMLFFFPGIQAEEKTFTLVIDPGHGGKDPGARGATTNEKNINLDVALKLGKMITDSHKDVKVVYTRNKDVFVGLDERANIANRNKADLFISIHTNAVKQSTVRGTETFTLGLARTDENLEVAKRENAAILLEDNYMQTYEGFDPNSTESYIIFEFMQSKHLEQSVGFASEIQRYFTTAKRVDRGVRQAGFLVLRKTSMPSVLVELGFISNREEERYMVSANGQSQLTTALYNAFAKYKKEYDRKQGARTVVAPPPTQVKAVPQEANNSVKKSIVYKIQILTSDKKLPTNSRQLKGYKDVDYYMENGLYKYTVGSSENLNEIKKQRQKVAKDFKDAFVIKFQDGVKVKN